MDVQLTAHAGRVKTSTLRPFKFPACVSVFFALLVMRVAAQPQPLVVTTVAGLGNYGNADGIGSVAKFLFPTGVALDGVGNLYVADANNDTIRKITDTGVVTTLAGAAQIAGTSDGTGSTARFDLPYGVAVDSVGNVFVADYYNNAVRKITTNGAVTTISANPSFYGPLGIAVDGSNNVYVADTYNNMIRKIANGVVTTLAGSQTSGTNNATGTNAQFSLPYALATDSAGNVYVADTGNNLIRLVTPAGVVTTIAGTGGTLFSSPSGIAVDSATNVYVADTDNQIIRKVSPSGTNWVVSTLAGGGIDGDDSGNGDGIYPQATFYYPWGLAVDSATNVYVGDSYNGNIRKISPAGVLSTLAGPDGSYGGTSANSPAAQARFNQPNGVAVDSATNLYVADTLNNCIREVTSAGTVTTLAGLEGQTGSADGINNTSSFNYPSGLCIDAASNIYVADYENSTVRKISPTNSGSWFTSTLAGKADLPSYVDAVGTNAQFDGPYAVAVDNATNVYVADSGNNAIRKITPGGSVSTYAGNPHHAGGYVDATGTNALFNDPLGIAVDSFTNVYVADASNNVIRIIAPGGVVTTFATNNGGLFNSPQGIAVDSLANVYVVNTGTNTILGLNPGAKVTNTIAGTAGFFGSADGLSSSAQFDTPIGVAVDSSGNVYVADTYNNTIRKGTVYAGGQTAVLTLNTSPSGIALELNGTNYPATPQVLALAVGSTNTATVTTTNTVTSTATNDYVFTNWTLNGSVVGTFSNYNAILTTNETLVANFIPLYTLTVNESSPNRGAVSGGGLFLAGSSNPVTATASNGYVFTSWMLNGSVVSTSTNYTFPLDGNETLVAILQQAYTLGVSASPASGGAVSGGGSYLEGSTDPVMATASNGYTFIDWTTTNGAFVTSNASYPVTLNTNVTLVANFAATPPQIAVLDTFNGITNAITNGETNVTFGSVQINQPGPTMTFTVTNIGGQPLTLISITGPSGYTLNTNSPLTITNFPFTLPGVTNGVLTNGTFSVQLITSNLGAFSGNIIITNNAPTNGTFIFSVTGTVAPSSPQIRVFTATTGITNSQTVVPFGSVLPSQLGSPITFTVMNTGEETLDLTNITVPPGYTLNTNPPLTITNFPFAIPPGNSGTFSVQLNGMAVGNSGSIIISNNDTNNNPFVIPITGQVTSKTISLGGSLAFGVVPIGSSANGTFTINNVGNAPLTVNSISYGRTGFTGNWTSGQITAGNSQQVMVTFASTAAINYGSMVTVNSDATSGSNTLPIMAFGANTSLVLTVLTNGTGTVTPNDAKLLKQGTKYSLKAVPGSGDVFAGWTGSFNITNNPLSFTMETSTILQANFIPNPFLPFVGTYNGLFWATNGIINEETAGMLKGLTLTSKGTYSGSLLIDGTTKGITGSFDTAGQASKSVSLASEGEVTLAMTLTSNNPAPQVTGTVSTANWVATNLVAYRATNNTQLSPQYTLLIPPDTNSPSSPGGYGYASITTTVGTTRTPATARITGSLADGTTISPSMSVSRDGYVPIYANLYSSKGFLLGWVNLDPTNTSRADLYWVHSAHGLFPSADSTNQIALSPWTNSPAIFGFLTNLAELDGINGTNIVTNVSVNISSAGRVTEPSVSVTITPKTGLFTVTIGSGASKLTGHGAILFNGTNGGGGYFVTKSSFGAVLFDP